jgi:hypothetical protein
VRRNGRTVGCHVGGGERGGDEDSMDWSNMGRSTILRRGILQYSVSERPSSVMI